MRSTLYVLLLTVCVCVWSPGYGASYFCTLALHSQLAKGVEGLLGLVAKGMTV